MGPDHHARRDRWCAAGLGLFAVGYLAVGRGYALDTLTTPGPGVFPLVAGLALLTLAIWQFAVAGRHRPPDAPAAGPGSRTSLVLAGALVLYAAALPRLGFLVASVALVLVTARLMGLDGWWRPAALALGVTLAARVVFVSWLGVPLP